MITRIIRRLFAPCGALHRDDQAQAMTEAAIVLPVGATFLSDGVVVGKLVATSEGRRYHEGGEEGA